MRVCAGLAVDIREKQLSLAPKAGAAIPMPQRYRPYFGLLCCRTLCGAMPQKKMPHSFHRRRKRRLLQEGRYMLYCCRRDIHGALSLSLSLPQLRLKRLGLRVLCWMLYSIVLATCSSSGIFADGRRCNTSTTVFVHGFDIYPCVFREIGRTGGTPAD